MHHIILLSWFFLVTQRVLSWCGGKLRPKPFWWPLDLYCWSVSPLIWSTGYSSSWAVRTSSRGCLQSLSRGNCSFWCTCKAFSRDARKNPGDTCSRFSERRFTLNKFQRYLFSLRTPKRCSSYQVFDINEGLSGHSSLLSSTANGLQGLLTRVSRFPEGSTLDYPTRKWEWALVSKRINYEVIENDSAKGSVWSSSEYGFSEDTRSRIPGRRGRLFGSPPHRME